ncbi:cytochrome c biogenesis CcdA family protein [Ethanoligenens harbinense]|uniref:Cytochrome c biogenesis protein transmembrane region n=1 Tax=Ethanoligenens harbinense (strain DSM 18485 / JCM 12961 / CGMCC 1.5033 / YUAN-3) TaxID=663278 RepID=E6U448_ETHHY|nr:cytochrome c biogenesis protein CcdA [Ethanoligenens harbinense]ADU26548.1 cytochrome c biogenesis protein transmembrane region [Ethanoligenens harbinense YUAN-3]AVQ95674.1 cytochrome C biogenesis protein CcdA [Ethanoligenens harbinense YUAN-3]AYF38337.1 cytochrome C biogenesis protein CcdA [Ethanoligenens harbinense]AYF41082.1 cytochrome C biogenesis protein CcdA [Ethanoligenens harbinense]QCN91913.1 cytochrome C biogenesis protein CcdA [Ethanoligenens harbinense]
MTGLLTFLEGIVTFLSPCILPMLPVYVFYFAGGEATEARAGKKQVAFRALGFVLGFTTVFLLMGLAAGVFGHFLRGYAFWVHMTGGAVWVLFGLDYIGAFAKMRRPAGIHSQQRLWEGGTAYLFGLIFAVSWMPCVGVFLGSALVLAASAGGAAKGTLLLLLYSAGLGIPFVLCAVLIDSLRGALTAIRKHLRKIQLVCGFALMIVGVLMAFGLLDRALGLLSVL